MSTPTVESYLVVGGCGFLGSAVVRALLARGEANVAIFDVVRRPFEGNARVFLGDVADKHSVSEAIRQCAATCIVHTASPVHGLGPEIYWKVNVEGTRTLLSAAAANGVRKFVYTSSTGVVYTGKPLNGIDESAPIPPRGFDSYHETKARAEELALRANGNAGLRTVALRPSAMYGPYDRQAMHSFSEAVRKGQARIQIGDNTNLYDWAYVGNVADAHLLAADKLESDEVAGQAFFVTDGRPITFWDFSRLVCKELGHVVQPLEVVQIPRTLAMFVAYMMQLWGWFTGTKPALTPYIVLIMTNVSWYNIDKARRVLNYEPRITVEDGVARMVQWWKAEGENSYASDSKAKS